MSARAIFQNYLKTSDASVDPTTKNFSYYITTLNRMKDIEDGYGRQFQTLPQVSA